MVTNAEAATGQEIVVYCVRRDAECSECHHELARGSLLRRGGDGVLCLGCADLDILDFRPRGDTALTRRARKYSTLQAVVVEWTRSRQRYERQGVLVAPDALLTAEQECLADAAARERQRERTKRDPEAVHLAVVAHVRHTHTDYDRLLGQLWDRRDARERVRADVANILRRWFEKPLQGGRSIDAWTA